MQEQMSQELAQPDNKLMGTHISSRTKPKDFFRRRHIAALKAQGMTNTAIAKQLKTSRGHITKVLKEFDVREEIYIQQDLIFADAQKIISQASVPAAIALKEASEAEWGDKDIRSNQKIEAAKWLLEKKYGKAKQELEISGNVLVNLIDSLDAMKQVGKAISEAGEVIDVTPDQKQIEAPKKDKWESWISGNLITAKEVKDGPTKE